jgi:LCP family protein required for cell wall assembly
MFSRKLVLLLAVGLIVFLLVVSLLLGERSFFWQASGLGQSSDLAVLVLGQVAPGEGGRWHHSPNLTDSLILVYYRPATGTVNLISLPRDLYGNFGGEWMRINEVLEKRKINDLLAQLPAITGITVDKFVVVDLSLVKAVVDALGGIEVNLPAPVVDSVTGYVMPAGVRHLNGDDTVWLIRNRYSPEGDFFREKNQHLIVKAIFARLNELNFADRTKFFLAMLPEVRKVRANFGVGEIIPQLETIKTVRFNSVVLDFSTGLLVSSSLPPNASSSAYILVPKEGVNNYQAIREYIVGHIK